MMLSMYVLPGPERQRKKLSQTQEIELQDMSSCAVSLDQKSDLHITLFGEVSAFSSDRKNSKDAAKLFAVLNRYKRREEEEDFINAVLQLRESKFKSSEAISLQQKVLSYIKLQRKKDLEVWLNDGSEPWYLVAPGFSVTRPASMKIDDPRVIEFLNILDEYIMMDFFKLSGDCEKAKILFAAIIGSAGSYGIIAIKERELHSPMLSALIDQHFGIKKDNLLGDILAVWAGYIQGASEKSSATLLYHLASMAECLYNAVLTGNKRAVQYLSAVENRMEGAEAVKLNKLIDCAGSILVFFKNREREALAWEPKSLPVAIFH